MRRLCTRTGKLGGPSVSSLALRRRSFRILPDLESFRANQPRSLWLSDLSAFGCGAETAKPACVGLDECACIKQEGCSVIAQSCYCPFPQCGPNGACICGGGKFIGCAPADLSSCTGAKASVAKLCPDLYGATFENLCKQDNAECITKCLNDVGSCGDVLCTFCEDCKCMKDSFSTCIDKCVAALTP
jgi:hypothetical protein